MNLKFDVAVTDDLFKAYSQRHNSEFKPIGSLTEDGPNAEYQVDKFNNKIYPYKGVKLSLKFNADPFDRSQIMKNIARKVRENADLFAQIEANTRGMEADKVKKYDIELIAKEFEYYGDINAGYGRQDDILPHNMLVTNDMPLCVLATIAKRLYLAKSVHFISKDINFAVSLHLFVQLCLEAGYPNEAITWTFTPDSFESPPIIIESTGTTAVVTSTADIESALACILDASQDYRYPWRLRRVLVQENAFARFKRALTRSTDCAASDHPHLAARSASAHKRGDKCFLVEFCGADADVTARQRLVLVAAYRTTSELLTQLRSIRPEYLSLWCSDVSVSNEIAFGARCSVWLNDFAWLQGSHRRSHSWVMVGLLQSLRWEIGDSQDTKEHEEMTSLRAEWLRTGIEKRREVILEILRSNPYSSEFQALIEDLAKWEPQTFVHIESGTLYQGFEEARGFIAWFGNPYAKFSKSHWSMLLLSVVNGNGVYCKDVSDKTFASLVGDLNRAGVPVMLTKMSTDDILTSRNVTTWVHNSFSHGYNRALYNTRVISCHFGETFAN